MAIRTINRKSVNKPQNSQVFVETMALLEDFFIEFEVTAGAVLFLGAPLAVSFIFYNKPPAKVYLGDAGSLFIGGFIAAIPLLFPWSSISFEAYYAPIVILSIPLLELFSLIVINFF